MREQSAGMIPLLETRAPFVIKIYDSYFNVSGDGLSDKQEDNYYYSEIKTVLLKKGEWTLKRGIVGALVRIIFNVPSTNYKDSDELIIEFTNGEKEKRYFSKHAEGEHCEAIDLIKSKLGKRKKYNRL